MNFNLLLLVFTLSCLIILTLTFFAKRYFLNFGIMLSLIFYVGIYYVTSELVGIAKPIEYNIPLFSTKSWPKEGLTVLTYYYNTDRLYLLLNSDDSIPRLYSMPFDAKYIKKLKDALEEGNKTGNKVKIKPAGDEFDSTNYGDADTSAHQPYIMNEIPPPRPPKMIDSENSGGERTIHND